jgi:hypothetical protein
MAEVAVAFPGDEPSAHVIASRLGAAGIPARVDRGLAASYQVGQRGQVTVLVNERHAKKAYKVLGTSPRRADMSEPVLRLEIVFVVVALAIGAAMIVVLISRMT